MRERTFNLWKTRALPMSWVAELSRLQDLLAGLGLSEKKTTLGKEEGCTDESHP